MLKPDTVSGNVIVVVLLTLGFLLVANVALMFMPTPEIRPQSCPYTPRRKDGSDTDEHTPVC